jgi:hypothetical protein
MALTKTAGNALIQYESSVTEYTEALTDSGDHTVFNGTPDVYSNNGSLAPVIMPDGIVTGVGILTPHVDDDKLSYSAFTAYVSGELKTVTASTVTITRASVSDYVINSIQYDGSTVSAVKGVEGDAFVTTRGSAGGPPYIAVGSIEIGQVKTTSQTAAPVETSEIFQSANGGTQERYDYPNFYTPDALGQGNAADDADKVNAFVEFVKALPASHTGDVVKGVYAVLNEPDFTDIEVSDSWVPASETPSSSSQQVYRRTTATPTKSLGTAGFTIYWSDPTTNPLRKLDGKTLTFKFFPDADITTEYELTQGVVGFAPTYGATEDMQAAVTIAASSKTITFG